MSESGIEAVRPWTADMERAPARWHTCPPDPDCPHCRGEADPPLSWDFVDVAFCICLDSRHDRLLHAAREFHHTGLCRRVVFHRPSRHPEKGIAGSWESHRVVLMRAMEAGAERALVFEDDVLFVRRITPRLLASVSRALDSLPPDWTVFYLGHWPLRVRFVAPHVLRTSSGCIHAYVASRRLMEWLAERPWGTPGIPRHPLVGKALDSAFALLPGTYAYFPMLATQVASPSDNFTAAQKKRKKKFRWRHLVTHSRHREWLLSRGMRVAEAVTVALSPLTPLLERISPRLDAPPGGPRAP
ncbi:hypothetical protein HRbin39_01659 [bacterium HR39]|nr:hypothetical protein HRbin39_01659 [bacterium HR39]